MEAHKTHSGVKSLQEAAGKKISDLQAVLERINALDPIVAGIKADHNLLLKDLLRPVMESQHISKRHSKTS